MGIMHKNTAVGAAVANANLALETVLYVTPVLQLGPGDGAVNIAGTVNALIGAAGTALTIRCRQGANGGIGATGPAGTQVGPSETQTAAAASTISQSFGFTDTTPYLEGGGQYAITGQQTSATGNGTTNFVDVEVQV